MQILIVAILLKLWLTTKECGVELPFVPNKLQPSFLCSIIMGNEIILELVSYTYLRM
jgi:hypothetical protein